ncbi:NAD-dependent epimerase/dehydratase family protein [Halobacillus halophilus]|uniref:NAD-dependent epimerase/dehydratase family protein n=1 Tax=Halobacillus halophilus TaxID=1570 RepID=UPI001CD34908|nr:NAD-dependent epimerase/dehydratase family protein [Halobacillus halophilus]MCA1012699.1 NAD-dependent epimerase/dehydratase family protein [Halobacillus halophilus]
MSRVLITGGAGFIGGHTAVYLADKGFQIDLVDNMARGVSDEFIQTLIQRPNVRLVQADLLNPDGLSSLGNDYEYIVHFAAILGVAAVLNRPYQVLKDNLLMLLNLISFAEKQSALKRVLFASTSEVYAGTLAHFQLPIPTPESTPIALTELAHPRTSYMLSKLYGEALLEQSGLPFTIIRPHNIYGPRMGLSHVIPELLKKAHEAADHSELEVFSVDHKRTFCYVEDAVHLLCKSMLKKDGEGKVLNIGNQDPEITIRTLAEKIISTVGKNLTIISKPATAGSPARRCPDITEVMNVTGYKPLVGLEEGITRTYQWYKKNVFSGEGPSAI